MNDIEVRVEPTRRNRWRATVYVGGLRWSKQPVARTKEDVLCKAMPLVEAARLIQPNPNRSGEVVYRESA